MRTFTRIRNMFIDNTELRLEIEKIKTKLDNQDKNMDIVYFTGLNVVENLLSFRNQAAPLFVATEFLK